MLKVLLVTPYPPARDGIGQYGAALHDALVRGGAEVAVASVRHSPRPEVLGCLDGAFRSTVDRAVRWRPDAIHVQHAIAAYGPWTRRLWRLVAAVRRATGAAAVVTHHEVTRDVRRTGWTGRHYYRYTARHTDVCHVHTSAAAELYADIVGPAGPRPVLRGHPVAELPAPGDAGRLLRGRLGIGDRPLLLCFGFIHVDKGLDVAVRALAALRRDAPALDPHLAVVGEVRRRPWPLRWYEWMDHRHLAAVRQQAVRLGVDGAISQFGYCPDEDIPAWFAAADAVLLPYRRAEQSGVAQLAVAAGTPVVAAPAGGLAELFGGTPGLLPSLDPQAVADSIRRVLGLGRPAPHPVRPHGYADLRDLYPHIPERVQ